MTEGPEPRTRRARGVQRGRCHWVPEHDPLYVRYHDEEWGRPVHEDRRLFEMLILEGAQAGLSWSTILRRRAALRRDPRIVRNRLKIDATVTNAQAFLAVQREFGSFDRYLWSFVEGKPLVNRPRARVPARTALSDRLSKDLLKRGFRFVGSTIIYAFLQAVGVVNDHARGCFLCPPVRRAPAVRRFK
jgi:DNA-3-methyladenine glycosylase I